VGSLKTYISMNQITRSFVVVKTAFVGSVEFHIQRKHILIGRTGRVLISSATSSFGQHMQSSISLIIGSVLHKQT
jgi:hypothetical protein